MPTGPGQFRSPQARFLADCFGTTTDIQTLLKLHGSSMADLYRWLRGPKFRGRLRRAMQAYGALRDLELSLSSVRATRKLTDAMDLFEGFSDIQRKVCVDLIKLSRERRRTRQRPRQDKAPPLIAPGVRSDEAHRLIARLSRKD